MPAGVRKGTPPQVSVERIEEMARGGENRYRITILLNETQLKELQGAAQRSLARRTGPYSGFFRLVEQAIEKALTNR